jgi:hypothetical protein
MCSSTMRLFKNDVVGSCYIAIARNSSTESGRTMAAPGPQQAAQRPKIDGRIDNQVPPARQHVLGRPFETKGRVARSREQPPPAQFSLRRDGCDRTTTGTASSGLHSADRLTNLRDPLPMDFI